jgi:hypothetical protein
LFVWAAKGNELGEAAYVNGQAKGQPTPVPNENKPSEGSQGVPTMFAKISILATVALVTLLNAANPAAAQNPQKIQFIVRYSTSGNFVLVRDFKNDLSNGFDAQDLARRRLNPLGFHTRIEKKKSTGFDSPFSITTRIRTRLFARTNAPIERTFNSMSEATKFHNSLISLVKDKGLTVQIKTR